MTLGAHRSTAGGLHRAFAEGEAIDCEAIQIFTSSPQQWQARALDESALTAWHETRAESPIRCVLAHDSYLINLASPDDALLAKSEAAFGAELDRCDALGIPFVVSHPGSHVGSGEADGLVRNAEALRRIYDRRPNGQTVTLLETTAGQGSCLGAPFEHLAQLLELADLPERLGVCLDTCHVFAAGYDLRDDEAYAATIREFDQVIGLDRLKAIHLNDSKTQLGSRKDRHERIGQGHLGDRAFQLFLTDPRLAEVPMVIETPPMAKHDEDLARLRRLRQAGLAGRVADGPTVEEATDA